MCNDLACFPAFFAHMSTHKAPGSAYGSCGLHQPDVYSSLPSFCRAYYRVSTHSRSRAITLSVSTAICKLAIRSLSYSCRLPASYTMDQHPWAHGGFLWNPSYTASRSLLHSHALSHPILTLSLIILTGTQSCAPRQSYLLSCTS